MQFKQFVTIFLVNQKIQVLKAISSIRKIISHSQNKMLLILRQEEIP